MRIVLGMAQQIQRRARGVGGPFGDDVGHLLQTAAVDGQEPEPRAQPAHLDNRRIGEQL